MRLSMGMVDFLGKMSPVAGMINPALGAGLGAIGAIGGTFGSKPEDKKKPPVNGTVENTGNQWSGFNKPWGDQPQQTPLAPGEGVSQTPQWEGFNKPWAGQQATQPLGAGEGVMAPPATPMGGAVNAIGSTLTAGLGATNASAPDPNNYQNMKNTSAARENNVMNSEKDNNFGLIGKLGNLMGSSTMGEIGAVGQLLYGLNDKQDTKRVVDPYTQQMQSEALRAQSSTNNAANNTVAASISGANAMAQRNMDTSIGNTLATGGDVNNSALSAIKSNTMNTQLGSSYGNAVAQGAGMSAEGNWRKAATSGEAANQTMYRDEIKADPNNTMYTLMGGLPNVARAGQSFKQQSEDMSNFKASSDNGETENIFKQIDSNPNMLQFLSPAMRNNYKYYKQRGGA